MRGTGGVFWRWWAAGATSSAGAAVGAVALPLTAVTVLEASPLELGLVTAAGYVAWIVIGLPAGVLVQRLPLRGVQVGADLVRALALASVPLAWWSGHLTITHLALTALVLSVAEVVFDVANSTFLPGIVGRDQLQSRNSLTSATHAVTATGGPSAGGLLVQVLGAVPTLLVDAVGYLVSAVLLRTLPARRVAAPVTRPSVRAMIGEGWRFVVGHPVMGPCTWAAAAVNLVCGAQLTLHPLYLVRELQAPVVVIGVLLAAEGVGSLVGAALVPRLTARTGSARALVLAGVVCVVGAAVVPWGTGWVAYAAFAAGNVVFAGGVVVLSVVTRTYRQVASPAELLPRVVATVRFISWGAIPVGGLVAGLVAGWVGSRMALLVFATATALVPLVLLLSPVRRLHELTDAVHGAPVPAGR
jgi:MFS family permease